MLLVERKRQVKNSAGGTQIWRVWTSSKNNRSLDISWWKLQGSSEGSEKRDADTVGRKDRTHTVIWGREELARVNRDRVQEGRSTCCVWPQVLPVRGRWATSIHRGQKWKSSRLRKALREDQHQNQLPRPIPLERSTVPWIWCHQPWLPVKEWPHGKRDFPYLIQASKPIEAQLSGHSWVFASCFILQVQFLPGCHVPLSQFAS